MSCLVGPYTRQQRRQPSVQNAFISARQNTRQNLAYTGIECGNSRQMHCGLATLKPSKKSARGWIAEGDRRQCRAKGGERTVVAFLIFDEREEWWPGQEEFPRGQSTRYSIESRGRGLLTRSQEGQQRRDVNRSR